MKRQIQFGTNIELFIVIQITIFQKETTIASIQI